MLSQGLCRLLSRLGSFCFLFFWSLRCIILLFFFLCLGCFLLFIKIYFVFILFVLDLFLFKLWQSLSFGGDFIQILFWTQLHIDAGNSPLIGSNYWLILHSLYYRSTSSGFRAKIDCFGIQTRSGSASLELQRPAHASGWPHISWHLLEHGFLGDIRRNNMFEL